jgi:hypothetical protein
MVFARLNMLAQAKSTVELAQFVEGDRVQFTANDGSVKHGTVLHLNKKIASVCNDEGQSWKAYRACCARAPTAERKPWRQCKSQWLKTMRSRSTRQSVMLQTH